MTAAVVDDYQHETEALAASTVAAVLALYAALQAGALPPAVVVTAVAAVIATANAAATTLADVAVSAQIEAATGAPAPPTGIAPSDDTERLARAVATVFDDADEPAEPAGMRLERLARSEPLEKGHAVTAEIVNRSAAVEGWTRRLDADPCERCVRWAEDGRVFPKGHHFKRHYGCNCQAEIVTTERKPTP
ncbi:hypothetical protein ACN27E_07565 [Mycobacterium sp. WMMD1722]|uniref:hypothetical protein n=1 Tax=Mycobacterium sp. WMMD1722 TaxID=3404117 RepID=UPI003BF4BF52